MGTRIRLQNIHVIGGILIDARYSRGDVPFCELQNVPGFPRIVEYNIPLEIDCHNFPEILYRIEDSTVRASGRFHPRLYRIVVPADGAISTVAVMD